MRTTTKILTAVTAVGLAASMAACSSSGPSKTARGTFKTLTQGTTTVVPAASFGKALKSLGVALAPEGKATANSNGSVSFPITGGNATIYNKGAVTPYVQGVIDHNGSGLTLTAGKTVVTLENFVIHPGNNSVLDGKVLVNGKVFAPTAPLFDLDGSTLKTPTISSKTGYATLSGTTIYVSQTAAGALNTAFALKGTKNALPTTKEAIEVGTAIIHVTGK